MPTDNELAAQMADRMSTAAVRKALIVKVTEWFDRLAAQKACGGRLVVRLGVDASGQPVLRLKENIVTEI